MASRRPFSYPRYQAWGDNETFLNGGTIEFFDAGTSNNRNIYQDAALTTTAPNPVTLNSRGEPQSAGGTAIDIYLDEQPYKIVLKDSAGVTKHTIDNYVNPESLLVPQDPTDATDQSTDVFEGTLSSDPSSGEVFVVDFQTANTTTTPTFENTSGSLGALTIKTRDGSALWSGALNGVHELQYDGTDLLVLDPESTKGVVEPEHATDGGTDAFASATNTAVPSDGQTIVRDFQSANTTTTPTLDGKTMTTRDGSALWAGAVSGVHDVQYDSGADTYLVLEPLPIDEDDMASDSDAAVPTQQSVKAYTDVHTPINIVTEFSADNTGTNDVSAAFNNALTEANSSGRAIFIPAGTYKFTSKPNDIDHEVTIRGAGVKRTTLKRDYAEGTSTNGLLNFKVGSDGLIVEDLEILATSSSSGGCAISIFPETDTTISWCKLSNLRLSDEGTDDWAQYTLHMNGTNVTSAPIGIRDVVIEGVWVFGAPISAVQLSGIVNLTWTGGGIFSAGGTSGRLNITGTATVNSSSMTISIGGVGDILALDQCERIQVIAGITGDLQNTSDAVDCVVLGRVEGTVQTNWTNSTHYGA